MGFLNRPAVWIAPPPVFLRRELHGGPSSRRAGSIPGAQRTLANRRDTMPSSRVTLAFSGLGIAPHFESHQEASRLRLIRDGAFAASDY